MIEIRADEHDQPITADGPHNHERTRAVAAGIDTAFRLLNYATMSPTGLAYPSDVYSVLGELSSAIHKLPQALQQMDEFITNQVGSGQAREHPKYGPYDGDANAAARALASVTREASVAASQLGRLLGEAQSTVRGLEAALG
ncbi:hypothetical protein D0T12_18365 [Actinomadura spongiicola]|uniref:Uncharacterized protein n=1 Tax=Actinomadura spongiicola TaxID=2303421 RepID=A0A372GFG3_9ACTN|nr:hypothetical protein [Actinomadura spongiicola]RFS84124.1 hypothetical protein D0T12_18365 [Actinomadura spongiicola]